MENELRSVAGWLDTTLPEHTTHYDEYDNSFAQGETTNAVREVTTLTRSTTEWVS